MCTYSSLNFQDDDDNSRGEQQLDTWSWSNMCDILVHLVRISAIGVAIILVTITPLNRVVVVYHTIAVEVGAIAIWKETVADTNLLVLGAGLVLDSVGGPASRIVCSVYLVDFSSEVGFTAL